MTKESHVVPFTIKSHASEKTLSGRIEIHPQGVELFFDGYGLAEMNPGLGSPLLIEADANGDPEICVWSDIALGDMTHKISLSEATEQSRLDDEVGSPSVR
jgi:hypothetical protein